MAKLNNAKFHLVHVIEPVYTYGYSYGCTYGYSYGVATPVLNSPQQYESHVRKKISLLGSKFGIPKENLFVMGGHVKKEILELAHIIDADLLVMGNHRKHGFKSLLNSSRTAKFVKDTECDMLAVSTA